MKKLFAMAALATLMAASVPIGMAQAQYREGRRERMWDGRGHFDFYRHRSRFNFRRCDYNDWRRGHCRRYRYDRRQNRYIILVCNRYDWSRGFCRTVWFW